MFVNNEFQFYEEYFPRDWGQVFIVEFWLWHMYIEEKTRFESIL